MWCVIYIFYVIYRIYTEYIYIYYIYAEGSKGNALRASCPCFLSLPGPVSLLTLVTWAHSPLAKAGWVSVTWSWKSPASWAGNIKEKGEGPNWQKFYSPNKWFLIPSVSELSELKCISFLKKWYSDPIPEILIHLVFKSPHKIQSWSWVENDSSKSSQLRSLVTASNYLDAAN